MKQKELKHYSNATEIDAEKIPKDVLNDVADVFFNIFNRMANTDKNQKTA